MRARSMSIILRVADTILHLNAGEPVSQKPSRKEGIALPAKEIYIQLPARESDKSAGFDTG